MGLTNLDTFIFLDSIAVEGASEKKGDADRLVVIDALCDPDVPTLLLHITLTHGNDDIQQMITN